MRIKIVFAILGLFSCLVLAQDSLNCREVGSWPFGDCYAVAVDSSRSIAFAGSGGGVYILSLANPAQPVKISEAIHTHGIIEALFYQAHRLYIAANNAGLEIYDVSTPSSPVKLGSCYTPDWAYGVAVLNNYAYVADGYSGLRVIDISDPTNPTEVGYYDTPGYALAVAVLGNYTYVADHWMGLRVIEFYGGVGIEEMSNLTASNIKIRQTFVSRQIFLDNPGRGVLALLDAAGRRVLKLKPGKNDIRHLAPGVYFVLKSGGETRIRKLVLIK